MESGSYCGAYDHSWLRTPDGNILDAYPVGSIGGPLLHDGDGPAKLLYKRRENAVRFHRTSVLDHIRSQLRMNQ